MTLDEYIQKQKMLLVTFENAIQVHPEWAVLPPIIRTEDEEMYWDDLFVLFTDGSLKV